MEENKLKVAPASTPEVAQEKREPIAFAIPANLFNQIVQFVGQGGYFQVEGLMSAIKTQSQPLYPQPKSVSNEAKNQESPIE